MVKLLKDLKINLMERIIDFKKFLVLAYLIMAFTNLKAQTNTAQYKYWPPTHLLNNETQSQSIETGEDWWYSVARIPTTHPTRAYAKYIASGYSTYITSVNGYKLDKWSDVFEDQPCYLEPEAEKVNGWCELSTRTLNYEGLGYMMTIAAINDMVGAANPPVSWLYNYGHGSLRSITPVSDGGYVAVGEGLNSRIPKLKAGASSNAFNIPLDLQGQAIPIYNHLGQTALMDVCDREPNPTREQAVVLKVSHDGRLEWVRYLTVGNGGIKKLEDADPGRIYEVKAVPDGIVVVGGTTELCPNTICSNGVSSVYMAHAFIAKLDLSGKIIWLNQLDKAGHLSSGGRTLDIIVKSSTDYEVVIGGELFDADLFTAKLKKHPTIWKYSKDGKPRWSTPLILQNNSDAPNTVRGISIAQNGDILASWLSEGASMTAYDPHGAFKASYLSYVKDYTTYGEEQLNKRLSFGGISAYDVVVGLKVNATSDGGAVLMGTKKLYHIPWSNRHHLGLDDSEPPIEDLNNCNFDPGLYYTDAFAAKVSSQGAIEWTTTFDSDTESPYFSSPLSVAGSVRTPNNLTNWINTETEYFHDIKRQECFYGITSSEDGKLLLYGNNSEGRDNSLIAEVENTCNLLLNNHLIQRIDIDSRFADKGLYVPAYIASTIATGREANNINEVAEFIVDNNAEISLTAGQSVIMREGSFLKYGSDVKISINPTHTCTPGPVYTLDDPKY
jgi:hypothetical protein